MQVGLGAGFNGAKTICLLSLLLLYRRERNRVAFDHRSPVGTPSVHLPLEQIHPCRPWPWHALAALEATPSTALRLPPARQDTLDSELRSGQGASDFCPGTAVVRVIMMMSLVCCARLTLTACPIRLRVLLLGSSSRCPGTEQHVRHVVAMEDDNLVRYGGRRSLHGYVYTTVAPCTTPHTAQGGGTICRFG